MKPLGEGDLILRGTRTVEQDGRKLEMAYAIAIDELCRWLAQRAEINRGQKTSALHGMIEARIIGARRSPTGDKGQQ